jgi:hypothetical protein
MSLSLQDRLPGITFCPKPAKPAEALPRMDIAAFVGFAAEGPFDEPVPVEDMVQFRSRFGKDLGLAWDPEAGETQYAFLSAAVESFFGNGGRRCWVVRVDTGPDAFLDPHLAVVGAGALMGEANHKLYVEKRCLRGLYSLLPVEEVTMIAVPDAVQRGLKPAHGIGEEWLAAPELELEWLEERNDAFVLKWNRLDEEAAYILEEATDPLFRQATTVFKGRDTSFRVSSAKEFAATYYYRVCGQKGTLYSPWSNTRMIVLPFRDFKACQPKILEAPHLQPVFAASPPAGDYMVTWTPAQGVDAAKAGYVLEEAVDPRFYTTGTVYSGGQTYFPLSRRTGKTRYYRVRLKFPADSPWSNTRQFTDTHSRAWAVKSPAEYDDGDLLAVQRALLRFCAARGDILALLCLPAHYRRREALDHVDALRSQSAAGKNRTTGSGDIKVKPLKSGELYTLSFGALYHPWTALSRMTDSGSQELRYIPPDGGVCGLMAARAIGRGAWVAPANEPLQGVVSLKPPVDRQDWLTFFQRQINLVRDDPRGYLVLGADTLSTEPSLQPINVRRLLILLRRLAMREGMTYVFEPNNEDFQGLVHNKFEQLLSFLYSKGAFAGTRPTDAYRVVSDKSVNTPASLKQGRFIIELRVAPSRPTVFITVKLIQSGEQGLTFLEA